MSVVATKIINIFGSKDKNRMDPERVKAKAQKKLDKRAKKNSYQVTPTVNSNGTIIYDFSQSSTRVSPDATSPSTSSSSTSTLSTSSSTTATISSSTDKLGGVDSTSLEINNNRRSWSEQLDSDKEQFANDADFADGSVLSHPSFMEPLRAKRIKVQNISIIYNPFSGSKIGEKIMNEAKKYFELHGLNVQSIPTEYKGHAEDLCRDLDVSGVDVVCLVGGDGTIHEAVNGIMKRDAESREKFVLACLPGGTGNSFVLELEGTFSVKALCEKILNGLTIPIDIGKVTCVKKQAIAEECNRRREEFRALKGALADVDLASSQLSESVDRKRQSYNDLKHVRPDTLMDFGAQQTEDTEVVYSFNSLHWGMGAKVNITAEKMRWMGKAVRYTTAALLELFKGEKILARIEYEDANGETTALEDEFCLAIINNIQSAAKGMKMAPFAKLNDGLFDLILVKSTKTLDLMNVFAKVYDGTHTELDYVIYKQVKRFSITPFKKDKERRKRIHKEKKKIKAAKRLGLEHAKTPLEILKTECNSILSQLEEQIEEEIIDIDGELKGATPFICEVIPRAVRVIV